MEMGCRGLLDCFLRRISLFSPQRLAPLGRANPVWWVHLLRSRLFHTILKSEDLLRRREELWEDFCTVVKIV